MRGCAGGLSPQACLPGLVISNPSLSMVGPWCSARLGWLGPGDRLAVLSRGRDGPASALAAGVRRLPVLLLLEVLAVGGGRSYGERSSRRLYLPYALYLSGDGVLPGRPYCGLVSLRSHRISSSRLLMSCLMSLTSCSSSLILRSSAGAFPRSLREACSVVHSRFSCGSVQSRCLRVSAGVGEFLRADNDPVGGSTSILTPSPSGPRAGAAIAGAAVVGAWGITGSAG